MTTDFQTFLKCFLYVTLLYFVSNFINICSKGFSQTYTSVNWRQIGEKPSPQLVMVLFTCPYIRHSGSASLAMSV